MKRISSLKKMLDMRNCSLYLEIELQNIIIYLKLTVNIYFIKQKFIINRSMPALPDRDNWLDKIWATWNVQPGVIRQL